MKPTELILLSDEDAVCIQNEPAKLTIVAEMMVNTNLEYSSNDDGYTYGNWKIEPFVGFKIVLDDGTEKIISSPKMLEKFGISYFEVKEKYFEGLPL